MAWRVGDVPVMTSSGGTTKVLFPGAVAYGNPPAPRRGGGKKRKDEVVHRGGVSYGVVYVNDVGRAAMEGEKPAAFPAGSVIVREKLAAPDAARPDLLVVMVKRARGFNPAGGDWEFLTLDGGARKIQRRQKKGSCLDCHAAQRERDFVFTPSMK